MIDRRSFIAGAGASLIAAPTLAQRPPERQKRLAVVADSQAVYSITELGHQYYAALFGELRRLGWEDGRNLQVERWSLLGLDRAEWAGIARRIVDSTPDVIFAAGDNGAVAAKAATASIPIVFNHIDPIGAGLGQSLAQPGGNATGFAYTTGPEFYQKMLQLLHEAAPQARRIAYFTVPNNRDARAALLEPAARKLGVTLVPIHLSALRDEAALVQGFAEVALEKPEAILVLPTVVVNAFPQTFLRLLAASGIPAMTHDRDFTKAGALMSYFTDQDDIYRQAAGYLDRVLRGTKPADLPIQLPMRFEFVVNLKTVKALGLDLPLPLMGFVSEWIE